MDSLTNMMDIYSDIIQEARSSHGDRKATDNLLDYAVKKRLVRYEETKKGKMIYSLIDDSFLAIHRGETDFHHLRRFVQKLEKLAMAA